MVCVKQAGSLSDEIEFSADGLAVDPDFLDLALNEWDACAIEEALILREAAGGEAVAVTVGGADAEPAVRRALAMGADRGVRIALDSADPLAVARALAEVARAESPDLVLCGAQSSDAANGAVGGALAGLLGLPFVGVVVKLARDASTIVAHRELEGGLVEIVECDLPAVVAVQTGINTPRYVTFRQIKQADATDLDERAADAPAGARLLAMALPERGEGAAMLAGRPGEIAARIAELVAERRS